MALIIPTSHLRARLTEALDTAIAERDFVIVTRHGRKVAAIVSMGQVERIWEDENLDLFGPLNPETGRPMGAAWVKKTGWTREREAAGGKVSGEAATQKKVERKRRWWFLGRRENP